MTALLDDEPVAAHFDLGNIGHFFFRGERRDLDFNVDQFARAKRREAWIGIGNDCRKMSNVIDNRAIGLEAAETSTQLTRAVHGDEGAHGQVERTACLHSRRRLTPHPRLEATSGEGE